MQFQSLSKFVRNWKRIIDKTNQHRAEFGPLRPTERVASQPKKAWTAGCSPGKFGGLLQKELREEVGPRVDFEKYLGFFCKIS